jgi:hypothetical protein
MRIKITPKFTKEQLRNDLKRRIQIIHNGFYQELMLIGEEFVKNARENGNYTDRTGNLRNSIGYIIFNNGQPITENIRQTVVPHADADRLGKRHAIATTDRNALAIARMKATRIAKNHGAKGFLLVCVAGMEYAAAVESRGKDVISASSIEAKRELQAAVDEWRKLAQGIEVKTLRR